MKKTVAALKARHAALKKDNAELNAKIAPKSTNNSTRVKSAHQIYFLSFAIALFYDNRLLPYYIFVL
jgi:hypothetical protein